MPGTHDGVGTDGAEPKAEPKPEALEAIIVCIQPTHTKKMYNILVF